MWRIYDGVREKERREERWREGTESGRERKRERERERERGRKGWRANELERTTDRVGGGEGEKDGNENEGNGHRGSRGQFCEQGPCGTVGLSFCIHLSVPEGQPVTSHHFRFHDPPDSILSND
ncbi:unnamed protein product [Pleuronectes platessa]|uniref:Uncharacterized protein n=1 Tax=Pleuronectes platessa TaxID=8262 RepID=A0A9N7V9C9_PLEPL|nr:unnamed protein product [Pleuronectes platessa]